MVCGRDAARQGRIRRLGVKQMIAEKIVARLEGVVNRGDGKWAARCPAHEDRGPSLSIGTGTDGRLLLHCFAGCEPEKILAALGLTWQDLFPDKWDAAHAAAVYSRPRIKFDQMEVERGILRVVAADIRAGKAMSVEDRARVEVARQRIAAAEGRHNG
jgi:hypothetical protein